MKQTVSVFALRIAGNITGDMKKQNAPSVEATRKYRQRAALRGLVRIELQASPADTVLLRSVALRLRQSDAGSNDLRRHLQRVVIAGADDDALVLFASDLPDHAFDEVFASQRDLPRDVAL